MKTTSMLMVALLLAVGAQAGDVYVTKDAQGRLVYTDTPQTVPAQKLGIQSASTNPAEVQKRYSDQMKKYSESDVAAAKAAAPADAAKTADLSPAERAQRCQAARERYQSYMNAHRLYSPGPNDERKYLSSAEIDAARASAKQDMDKACSGQ
jgi:acyl-CoA reductase-like NAD-dependent aldehyde dehydrogenase